MSFSSASAHKVECGLSLFHWHMARVGGGAINFSDNKDTYVGPSSDFLSSVDSQMVMLLLFLIVLNTDAG